MLKPGETLNRGAYRIERRLGAGGFGVVYLAEDVMLRRKVAIKIIREDVAGGDPQVAEAFYAEARLTAVLGHPYIIPIYSVGEEEVRGWHLPYVVMEYVEGGDLETVLARARPALPQRLRWMQQIAEGLAYAHQQGVLHRDLKPRNVFVARNQTVKIGDFGLAKVLGTDTKTVLKGVGTPAYISPEQIQGRPADARADLYALGIMYYQMCADRLPYVAPEGTDPTAQIMAIGYQHVHAPIPSARAGNPDVPPEVDALVQHLMAKEPGARPASADEVAQVLDRVVPRAPRVSLSGSQPGGGPSQPVAPAPAAPAFDTLARPAVAEVTHARAPAGRGDAVGAGGPELTRARPPAAAAQPVGAGSQPAVAAAPPAPARVRRVNRAWLAISVGVLVVGVGALLARSYLPDSVGKTEESAQAKTGSERRPEEARKAEEPRRAQLKAEEERKQAPAGADVRRADEERQARLQEEQRRLEEARRQVDEERRRAEQERKRAEEERKRAEEGRLREEQRRLEEARRQADEERTRADAERKRAEEARLARLRADEERKRAEEARLQVEQRRLEEAQKAEADRQARLRKELAESIEGSLRKAGLKNLAVAVNPERIVTLSGTVQDQREKDEAMRLAMLPPGVTEVRQNITVLAPQPIPGDLRRRVEQRLRESGLTLTVEVNPDQIVTLSGVLESEQKRQEAKAIASGVSGVKQVRDAIFIAPRPTGPVKIR